MTLKLKAVSEGPKASVEVEFDDDKGDRLLERMAVRTVDEYLARNGRDAARRLLDDVGHEFILAVLAGLRASGRSQDDAIPFLMVLIGIKAVAREGFEGEEEYRIVEEGDE